MLRESTSGAEPTTSFQPSAPEGGGCYSEGAVKEEKPSPRDESKNNAPGTEGCGLDNQEETAI